MLEIAQSNAALVVGAILVIAMIALRASSGDKTLRNDLRGAVYLLVAFLMARATDAALHGYLPPAGQKALRVAWMLLFAFGVIRSFVSVGLWILRFRSPLPTPKILRDVIDFSLYAFTALPILKSQLDIDLTGLLATSAIVSVVIGLALQDTLGNLFAGLSIQLERPFQVGDMVTIGEHTGRVMQIAWRATRLETHRREAITLPNSILSKQPVKNYSRGANPVGVDIYIGAAYDAPPNKVKDAVMEVVQDVPRVLHEPAPSCKTWAYKDSHVEYRIRYFVADYSADADAVLDDIYSRLWYRFRREGIEIPFPQRTLHMKQSEEGRAKQEVSPEGLSQLLLSVDLFSMLPEQDRVRLAKDMQLRRFGRGERIIERGTTGHTFYLVAGGEVAVKAGKDEVEVTRLKRGQYFGEMSLLTGEPRAATVVAVTDALLLELDRPVLSRLFGEHPNLARQLSALLAQRRNQLRAVAESAGGGNDATPEAGRIFGRLRQIFGLVQD